MCQDIAEAALDLLVDRLLVEAGESEHGWLERRDIAEIAQEFKRNEKRR